MLLSLLLSAAVRGLAHVGKITLLIVTEWHLTGLPRSPVVLHHDYAAEPLTTQSDYGRQLGRSA